LPYNSENTYCVNFSGASLTDVYNSTGTWVQFAVRGNQSNTGHTLTIYADYANLTLKKVSNCGLTFTTFPTNTSVGKAGGSVDVSVKLKDGNGNPVTTGGNIPTFSAYFPPFPPLTSPTSVVNPVGSDVATATFNNLPTLAGSYKVTVTSPPTIPGCLPVTINGLINVTHVDPVFINITSPWPNVPRTLIENTSFNITVAVLDKYGNVCNSSYGGTPFTGLVGVFQNLSTNPPLPPPNDAPLDPYVCTGKSVADNCTKCNCTHQFTASDEGVYNFTLLAYSKNFEIAGNTYEISSINNTPWNITLDFVLKKSIPTFDGSSHLVNIAGHPLPAENSSYLVVSLDKSQITPTEGITINVTAVYANGSINKLDHSQVQMWAEPGHIFLGQGLLLVGQRSFSIPSPTPLTKAGAYTINVFESANASVNGSAILFVVPGPLARILIYATPDVLQYMPFTVQANLTDAWDNTIKTYSGPVNFTSSDVTSVPKSDELTPLDEGQAFFEASANNYGDFSYNISALEPISGVLISNISTINVIKPLGCVNFTLQPASVGAAIYNISIKNTKYSPIQEVIDANNKVADGLIGWNSIKKKMEGNPIACVDEYFSTTMCFTATNVSFSKAPLLFCIKELTYTPSVDDAISDHYNYNGTGGDLLSTFKYPKVLWTWGATSLSGTLPTNLDVSFTKEICSDNGDKYRINATPRKLITNYFNLSTQMPAGIGLIPYNITNDSVLNPHEIRGNDGLLVTDEKNETVAQTGRLAKFNYSGNFYFQEAYTNDMIYPLGMASDQRGFIYVANNLTRDVKIFDIVPGKKPPLMKYIGIIQTSGYYPSGVATDSWNSLYVVGNTNPGSKDNKMCLEVYDKNKVLLTRNNCEVNASYRTIYGIAADPAGGIIYVAMANASIFAFNTSNASQQIGNMSIVIREVLMDYGCFNNKAPGGTLNCSIFKNFADIACATNMCEAPIYSDDPKFVKDRARGIAIKRGTLFVIDHVQYWSRVGWWGCSLFMCGGCGGCIPNPFGWVHCNGCLTASGYWTQITRLSAFDLETLQYLDYIDIQPPLMGIFLAQLTNPIGDFNFGERTYLTHGLDVVEDEMGNFEIYVAINNATRDPNAKHSIVMFKFNNSIQNFTRVGGVPYSKTLTTNVTHPHDVLVYPDLIKSTLSRGIICEGCSEKGQLSPKIIQQGMEFLNKSNESTPSPPVTGGGGFVARITGNKTATVERAYLKTNITGDVELTLDITIDKEPNGCVTPGMSQNIVSYTVAGGNPYVQEAKAYSNNLNSTVEGGNIAFYLTKPSYFVKPKYPPNTLPYLSYSFFSTRFLAKHFPLMNLVDNVMGPPANTSWLLNSTYRLNFTILNNSFFGYQFIKTNLFLHNQVYATDTDASPFLKTGQPIKYNSTINWEFPYKYEFKPVTLIPVKLPYTPYPGENASWCIDSDLMVHFFIKCRDTNGDNQTFGEWTSPDHELIVIGSCETLDAISVSGAMGPTNASIFPCG
jgi:hypothetical protein